MKILFSSEDVVDVCNGKLYAVNLSIHLERYRKFGKIVCVCYCRNVRETNNSELSYDDVEYVFTPKLNSLGSLFKYKKKHECIIREQMQRNDIDMAISHVPSDNSTCVAKYARLYNKPYMVVVVGCPWDSLWNYDWRGKILAPKAYFGLKRIVLQSPYALYVTSSFLQKRYPCRGFTESVSDVSLPKIDENVLTDRIDRIGKYTEGGTLNIVTVAAVDVSYKGQEYVIRAISKLNNSGFKFHYYLVGGGDNTYLRNIALNTGTEYYVHFIGALPHEEIPVFLDKMDIYIQPSKQEGLPRALVEGMSRGLPAIGTKVGGIPELLKDKYLVRAASVGDIINILSTYMNKESMQNQAQINFYKATEFQKEILDERRNAFISKFIKQYFG